MQEWTNIIINQAEALVKPLLLAEGMELVDITYRHEQGRWILALFVDKEGGVTIDDCVAISREFGDILDVKDIIPESYSLEVSSPGLDRPLKRVEDFNRFKDRKIRVKTGSLVEGKKNFQGILLGYQDGIVRVGVEDKVYDIPYESIVKARLDI
ncbi:MAG: ribosome maturation factor RimP [Pseudomonadota bacterium]